MDKLEFNLSHPSNGWINVKFRHLNFEINFIASNIPENPIQNLCNSLILTLNNIESEFYWNLEPEYFHFEFKFDKKNYILNISKSISINNDKKLIYKLIGDYESLILPFYRSLKKFNTLELDEKNWKKLDNTSLDKLSNLVNIRKKSKKQTL